MTHGGWKAPSNESTASDLAETLLAAMSLRTKVAPAPTVSKEVRSASVDALFGGMNREQALALISRSANNFDFHSLLGPPGASALVVAHSGAVA